MVLKKHRELTLLAGEEEQPLISAIPEPVPVHMPGPIQGHWTYTHYSALPEDGKRYEIIDGVLYLMPPSAKEWHQRAVVVLATYFTIHVQFAGLGRVYTAPFEVELTASTVVQPDILVIMNANMYKITPSHVVGSPDLVIEVVSPGTMRHDRLKKYRVYAKAGIREYWIVDPLQQKIEIVCLDAGNYHSAGVFSGEEALPSTVVEDLMVKVREVFE